MRQTVKQGGHKPTEILRISLNMENSGNSVRKFCAASGKNLVHLCKIAVDWVNRISRNRDEVKSMVVTCYITGVDVE